VRRCLVRPMSTFSMKDGGRPKSSSSSESAGDRRSAVLLPHDCRQCGSNDPTQAIGCAFHPVPMANLRVGWCPEGIDFHREGNIVEGTEPPSQSDRSLLFTSSQDPLERPLRSRIDLIRAKESLWQLDT
jgi:hypothetical protein